MNFFQKEEGGSDQKLCGPSDLPRWETRKVGPDIVTQFLELAEKVKEFEGREYFEGEEPFILKLWLFAHNGIILEAEALLRPHQIYWSTRADLDLLIQIVGLRRFPEMTA